MPLQRTAYTLNEAEVTVLYDYSPAEPAETGPEAQYPGCGAEVEVHSIYLEGVNIYPAIDPDKVDEISKDILKDI